MPIDPRNVARLIERLGSTLEQVSQETLEVIAAGGEIAVVAYGNFQLKSLWVSADLWTKGDPKAVQQQLLQAINEACTRVRGHQQRQVSALAESQASEAAGPHGVARLIERLGSTLEQVSLETLEVTAADGRIAIVAYGNFQLKSLRVSADLWTKGDPKAVQQQLLQAVNEACTRVRAHQRRRVSALVGGSQSSETSP